MKRRVMQKTLAERQKQIDAQRAKAQEIAKKAFETEEISRANKAYIDASFSAMTSDEDMSKTVEKARLEYQKRLKNTVFAKKISKVNHLALFATTLVTSTAKFARACGTCL